MVLRGVNARGEPIRNVFTITYTNECGVPTFQKGEAIGWVVFEDFEPASVETCPPPTPPPVATDPPAPPTESIKPTPYPTEPAPPITPRPTTKPTPVPTPVPTPKPSGKPVWGGGGGGSWWGSTDDWAWSGGGGGGGGQGAHVGDSSAFAKSSKSKSPKGHKSSKAKSAKSHGKSSKAHHSGKKGHSKDDGPWSPGGYGGHKGYGRGYGTRRRETKDEPVRRLRRSEDPRGVLGGAEAGEAGSDDGRRARLRR